MSEGGMPQSYSRASCEEMIYTCPICHASVELSQDGYVCLKGHPFPCHWGIPDFRIFDPPYVSGEEETRRVKLLMERYGSMSFRELVSFHLLEVARSNEPERLVQQHINFRSTSAERGTQRVEQLMRLLGTMQRNLESRSIALELGCGTGGNSVALSKVFEKVLGVDIAREELILARKNLEDNGVENVTLVCACAESLPFAENSFDLCNAEALIEHVRDAKKTIKETRRVLNANGVLSFNSPNRFSILPEPHVQVWGVGFLPRRFASSYVSLVRGIPYEGKRLLSFRELNRLLKNTYKGNYRVFTIPGNYANMGKPASTTSGRIYRKLNRIPLLNRLMRFIESCFLPIFEVIAFKESE
ncbi:methyltransferase domain-containing protein [Chloroflexota bacterium]